MPDEKVISADSHVQEPYNLFLERIPDKYHHRLPHIEEREGGTYSVVEGRKPRRQDIAQSRETEEDKLRQFRADESGGRDIPRRLADQEKDGVSAEIIYPNDSLALSKSSDPDYQMAVAGAYNDWAIEHFGPFPDRFVPVAIVPVADITQAVQEVERVAKLGYRAIKIPIVMKSRPYNLPEYEPLWNTIEDAGLILNLHAFSNSEDTYPEDWGEAEGNGGALNFMVMSMAEGLEPVSTLIASGMLERHPGINVGVIECGAGWLAWLLYALDEQAEKKHMWIRPKLKMRPSEYFKRQGHVSFGDDPVALATIPFIGSQCLLWAAITPMTKVPFPTPVT